MLKSNLANKARQADRIRAEIILIDAEERRIKDNLRRLGRCITRPTKRKGKRGG